MSHGRVGSGVGLFILYRHPIYWSPGLSAGSSKALGGSGIERLADAEAVIAGAAGAGPDGLNFVPPPI